VPASDDRSLLDRVRAGDEDAARQLYEHYVHRLLHLARNRISQRLAHRFDPEDVVQSVFRSFFHRVQHGTMTVAEDDLGKFLVGVTVRKTLRKIAFHTAAKRNPAVEAGSTDAVELGLARCLDLEPSPEATVAFLDELEHFFRRLNAEDREILELRLHGYTNEEIAERLGTYDRRVRRAMEHVRALAAEMAD
jgi:RNA polymerase sigma-70 factor, ECF subfamily